MRWRGGFATLVLLVIMAMAGVGVTGFLLVHEIRLPRGGAGQPSPVAAHSALAAATSAPAPVSTPSAAPEPSAASVARALAPRLADPALGGRVLTYVADAITGAPLYSHLATTDAAPASTAKLLTAAAVLAVHAATDRITTRVVAGSSAGTVVLVGGGDPTLTAATGAHPGAYPDAARIGELAGQLLRAHVVVSRVVVDDSLFTGASVSPAWAAGDVPSDYAAPITALMADGGRAAPGDPTRSISPDMDAGKGLATALGLTRASVVRGAAPAHAMTLAIVRSAPISELVEQMLQASDNVIAECLARQVSLARGMPASFLGAVAAIRSVLASLGADPGAGMHDGSGLAATDRISAAALVSVLRLITSDANPRLHAIVTALPVAAWRGTLVDRYLSGSTGGAGAGVIRAKTGTLTGVSTLAGIVHDASGRLLVFALLADRVSADASATASAETALDRVAAALAGCGCA